MAVVHTGDDLLEDFACFRFRTLPLFHWKKHVHKTCTCTCICVYSVYMYMYTRLKITVLRIHEYSL